MKALRFYLTEIISNSPVMNLSGLGYFTLVPVEREWGGIIIDQRFLQDENTQQNDCI